MHDANTRAASEHAVPAAPTDPPAAPHAARFVQAVYRALQRDRRRRRTRALVDTVRSPVPQVQRRIRRLLGMAPLGERVRLASLAAEAMRAARLLRGVGDERALERLLADADGNGDAASWLRAVIALAAPAAPARNEPARDTAAPDALRGAAPGCERPQALLLLLP